MHTMIVEQHWYSSVPVGLSSTRGFQTVACSEGLGDESRLERHCAYVRPSGQSDGPVNWGWFDLGDDRACIHRIAYSGTDELGRPGNFMAHNLVVRQDDLRAIGHDVPSLIHWVRHSSPQQYPTADGGRDGFVRDFEQLYARFGQERQALRSVPTLEVPIDEVRQLRERARSDWQAILQRQLDHRSNALGLSAILQARLCESKYRRPILIVGDNSQAQDAELELQFIEILFLLLPPRCWADFTFATYEHDPRSIAFPHGPSTGPHRRRSLAFTTSLNDFGISGVEPSNSVWFVALQNHEDILPPNSALANSWRGWLEQRDFAAIEKYQNLVAQFQFPDEWAGLDTPRQLLDFDRRPTGRPDYDLFCRSINYLRPNSPLES
ncbi:MAG: hypothetical protein WCL32_22240, partial [Planctomycetota bacterium]